MIAAAFMLFLSSHGILGSVSKVTVYADRAQVIRQGQGRCSAGKSEIRFENLPSGLDARTLRAQAVGKGLVIGLSHRQEVMGAEHDERVKSLREQIQKLQDELAVLSQRYQMLGDQDAALNTWTGGFAQGVRERLRDGKPDTGTWDRNLSRLQGERYGMVDERLKAAQKRRTLERQVQVLQRKLDKFQSRQEAQGIEARVSVDCKGKKSASVELSYVVGGASWHPEYDLRFFAADKSGLGKGEVELTVAVVVRQATGEDWRGVSLEVSTAKPRLGVEAPWPGPIQVQGRPHQENKVIVQKQERREQLQSAQAPGAQGAEDIEDKGNAFAIRMGRKVTIESDGRPYWMPAKVLKGKAQSTLSAIPKLSPYVYQRVRLNNPASFGLVPGVYHIYRGASYVGDVQGKYRAPGEAMDFSLGIDESFRVHRETLAAYAKNGGFLNNDKTLMRGYRFVITNQSGHKATVEVQDNIPVSKTENLAVKLDTEKCSKGMAFDDHRGFVSWQVSVPSGKKAERDLVYSVVLPEDWVVR